jgi:hypothetical protein
MQLAQILLYELDSMMRVSSNTLWMRSTAIDVAGPGRPVAERLRMTTSLRGVDLLAMSGGVWRTAEIVARLGAIAFTCSVTHRLPAGPDPAPESAPETDLS